jgi:hypothetical protein
MLPAAALVGTADILWIVLDSLRYDVAQTAWESGRTPTFARYLPATGWERRHTPGSFTFAAHAAFFAGFLPTPAYPGKHPRLFALRFPGSETITDQTAVFDAPDLVTGLRQRGYYTMTIGGVGFFNQQSPIGSVFPSLFDECIWAPEIGVTARDSAENQVTIALDRVAEHPSTERLFLFLNIAATHQPTNIYIPDATVDTPQTQAAALHDVDCQMARLLPTLAARGPWLTILCSDHGTAFGEDGFHGHRLAHPTVWDVPYAEFLLTGESP